MKNTPASFLLCLAVTVASAADDPAARKYFYEDVLSPFFALDKTSGVYRPQRPDSNAAPFAAAKAVGTFRAFIVGGSIADEYVENPRGLGEALAAALPGLKLEVINTGMPGYDSFREKPIVQEVLDYSPDLIVLLTGHNESPAHRPQARWRLKLAEAFSRWGIRMRSRVSDPKDDSEVRKNFEDNLRAMLASARGRGVRVVVCVPPSNTRDAPARTSRESVDIRFLRGWIEYLKGDCGAARAAWETGPAAGGAESSWGLFYGARCAEKQNRREEARRLYLAAADTLWQGCPPRCQTIIRRIAREQGALLADVDAAFREATPEVMPGLEMFSDTMHWRPEHNRLVSLAILRALTAATELPWDRERLRKLHSNWSDDAVDRNAAARTTFKYAARELSQDPLSLNWLALSYIKHVHALMPLWFNDLDRTAVRLQAEMEASGREWNAPPIDKGSIHWHFGEVLLREGRYQESQHQFDLAVKARPVLRTYVLVSRALAWALSGDRRRADQALDEAGRGAAEPAARQAAVLAQALRPEMR